MPPGSRLHLPAQTQGTSTRLSARPLLLGLFSLVTGVRASPALNLRPPVVWWFQGPVNALAYIFPGFVFPGLAPYRCASRGWVWGGIASCRYGRLYACRAGTAARPGWDSGAMPSEQGHAPPRTVMGSRRPHHGEGGIQRKTGPISENFRILGRVIPPISRYRPDLAAAGARSRSRAPFKMLVSA
jgi:hypothetical protein